MISFLIMTVKGCLEAKTFSVLVRGHAKQNTVEEQISRNINVALFLLSPRQNRSTCANSSKLNSCESLDLTKSMMSK